VAIKSPISTSISAENGGILGPSRVIQGLGSRVQGLESRGLEKEEEKKTCLFIGTLTL
jgi:hypothetical protein